MPDIDDISRRRRPLALDVTQAAAEVSRLLHQAYDPTLPVEPGVRTAETPSSAGPFFSKG